MWRRSWGRREEEAVSGDKEGRTVKKIVDNVDSVKHEGRKEDEI